MVLKRRIAITGIGPLTAIGFGKDKLWESILNKKTGLIQEDISIDNTLLERFYVHRIKDFDISRFGINENILKDIKSWKNEDIGIDLCYLIAAVKLALDDSGLRYDLNDNKIGLVLAHENPGLDQFYWQIIYEFDKIISSSIKKNYNISKSFLFQKFYEKFRKRGYELQTFMFLYHVAKIFGIHGYSLFLNNACASGLFAIEAAADTIRNERCEAVIVAAADYASIFKYLWFKEIDMYAQDGKLKPFAKDANGFVFGDGAIGIVLEDLEKAKKRNAAIYAEYLGGSFCLEGWKITIPDPLSNFYKNLLIDVLKKAALNKEDIDLIVPHGVGTSVTDFYEAKAITKVFGTDVKKPFITAFKPYIGHTLGASALLETAILLLSLKHNFIPPTLNCENLDHKLGIQILTEPISIKLKNVLKIACGFAGYNGAAVFQKEEGSE